MKHILLNQYRTSVQHTLYSTMKDDRHVIIVDNFTPRECTTPEGTAVVRDINTDQLLFLPKRRLIQRGTYNVNSLNMAISQQFKVGETVLFQLCEYAQIKYNMYGVWMEAIVLKTYAPNYFLVQITEADIDDWFKGYDLPTDARLAPMSRRHEFQRYRWDDSESSYTFYKKK